MWVEETSGDDIFSEDEGHGGGWRGGSTADCDGSEVSQEGAEESIAMSLTSQLSLRYMRMEDLGYMRMQDSRHIRVEDLGYVRMQDLRHVRVEDLGYMSEDARLAPQPQALNPQPSPQPSTLNPKP